MQQINEAQQLEYIFSQTAVKELKRKIKSFESLYPTLRQDTIYTHLKDTLLIDIPPLRASSFCGQLRTLLPSATLWRSRKVNEFKETLDVSTFWAPSPEKVSGYGRMNRPSQGVLYTAEHLLTTLAEIDLSKDEKSLLIVYRVKSPLEFIGLYSDFDKQLSASATKKLNIINRFIKRSLLAKGEAAYLFSSEFVNEFMKIETDGWFYPSVARHGGTNYCIHPHAADKFELLKIYTTQGVRPGIAGPLLGVYEADASGTYHYRADPVYANADYEAFGSVYGGDGSDPDKTPLHERNLIDYPVIVTR
ncbi:RES family NAD+ phosphorylase [Pseudomonas poae]|uniref:RES family NAD+ phosphorylase n=1 Tax=Pseudomonas poae TaxID=200451 RepID=A0A7M1KMP0_9PSED|nr:RES family NAD+ phosphorylase [Pseudomonas poae]QOQ77483.1 RES family NAD+ phosphorylase [Pseudomonas poae]